MKELNKLTEHLLLLGYTKEAPPSGYRKWDDFYGGWQYSYEQERNIVVQAPCGVISNARYGGYCSEVWWFGKNWCLENDNALMRCPYKKLGCELNNPLIRDATIAGCPYCEVKIVERSFDYQLSAQAIEERNRAVYEERVKTFAKDQPWFCRVHMRYDKAKDSFYMDFDPMDCIGNGNACRYCFRLGRDLTTEKGNVFFDVKTTRVITHEDLFGDEEVVTLEKGVRLFDTPQNLDKCLAVAERPDLVKQCLMNKSKYYLPIFWSKYHGRKYELEVLNVRAMKREARDLAQDLADIAAGIKVIHASDIAKDEKQAKQDRKAKALRKRLDKLLRLYATAGGYDGMDITDQHRLKKAVERGQLTVTELKKAQEDFKKKQTVVVDEQLSLFDSEEKGNEDGTESGNE